MTDPTPLSPAAQAVLYAAHNAPDGRDSHRMYAAAALRAAADQVVPEQCNSVGDEHDAARSDQWTRIRYKFLAIASELEGIND